jgi:O-antigen ligase/tetratricopeptide (TPR) repeat protein
VSAEAVVAWARRRTTGEWVGLAAALAVFGYVGWDGALWDARLQLLLHLIGIGAVAGLGVAALRGRALPRTPLDLPILGLLAVFAVATLSAANLGMSLRAMAAIAAFASMLPVALVAVRDRPSWVGAVTAVPVLVISIPTLMSILGRRLEWIAVGAPGLPPIRLPAEGTPFGSIAVPPFVIWPAFALAGLIEPPRWRRAVQAGLVAVGIPLTILSGSRSAWLAMAVAVAAAAVPWGWRRRHRLRLDRRPDARALLTAAAALVGLAALIVVVAPRLTAVTSLIYRASLWRDTLSAWSTDPLLGIGPGFMPYARQAAAPDLTFPVRQPHSHNLPLGLLGDAGLLGLLAGGVLVVAIAWFAGPWRARSTTGRVAGYVLLGLGVGGLFEDLTFLPGFDLLAITLLAVALTDAGAVAWRPLGRLRMPASVAIAAAAVALLAAMVVADAGAIAYRAGSDAAARRDWGRATERLERAVEIDRWHPSGPKALAVAAEHAGLDDLARRAAEAATVRNPGDAPSWINLALLCAREADAECQARATERAVAKAGFFEAELLNAAFSYEALGRTEEADDAYRRSLLSHPLTGFAGDWPRVIEIGDAALEDDFGALLELNRLLAWWAMGEPIEPDAIADPASRALAHAIRGERHEAEAWLARAIDASPESIVAWDLSVVLHDHWGLPIERDLAIAAAVRGRAFPEPDADPAVPRQSFDIGSFRAHPADGLISDARRLGTRPQYPWILQQVLP